MYYLGSGGLHLALLLQVVFVGSGVDGQCLLPPVETRTHSPHLHHREEEDDGRGNSSRLDIYLLIVLSIADISSSD